MVSSLLTEPARRESFFSEVIDFMRFPLAIFVVAIHWNAALQTGGYIPKSGGEVSGLISSVQLLYRYLLGCAVPTFFIISGYLFFRGKDGENRLTAPSYLKKLKRRIWTLLIPFLIWNILTLLAKAYYLPTWCCGSLGAYFDNLGSIVSEQKWHIFWDARDLDGVQYPILVPLWYIRDLMVVVLCAPLFYVVLKPMRHRTLSMVRTVAVFAALIYLGTNRYWPFAHGASYAAVLWFGAGSALALHKGESHLVRYAYIGPVLFLCCIALLFLLQTNGIKISEISQIFRLGLVFGLLMSVCFLLRYIKWRFPRIFVLSTMFIYCWHDVALIGSNSILFRGMDKTHILQYCSAGSPLVFLYMIIPPVLSALAGVVAYFMLRKYLPRIAGVLVGKS